MQNGMHAGTQNKPKKNTPGDRKPNTFFSYPNGQLYQIAIP